MKQLTLKELLKIDSNIRFNHPNFELQNLLKLIDKVGTKRFLESPKYDGERDMFIACMFSYAVRLFEKREWFLRRGSNPPDFEMVAATDRKIKERPIDFTQVEIVQIPPYFSNLRQAFGMIKRKKLGKYTLEEKSILLIFINNHKGPQWSEELGESLVAYKGNFSQIWVIYLLRVSLEEFFVYSVKCVNPRGDTITLSLKEELTKGLIYKHSYLDKLGAKII